MIGIKPGSKYHQLHVFLRGRREESVVLTFGAIEKMIGDALPESARAGKAFWSNRSQGALQASAWVQAGFLVTEVDLSAERVTFRRPVGRYHVQREGGEVVWDGTLVRALRDHLGVNQADLAELLGVRQQTISEWETGVYVPTRARSKHLTMVAERAGFTFGEGRKRPKA